MSATLSVNLSTNITALIVIRMASDAIDFGEAAAREIEVVDEIPWHICLFYYSVFVEPVAVFQRCVDIDVFDFANGLFLARS